MYLNGIASDHYLKNEKRLTTEEKQTLTEWDSKNNRPKHLSLREKALKYPRMILGVEHPPLQENNCPELGFIIGKAKALRDAIVHPAARREDSEYGSDKRQLVYLIEYDEVEQVVDNAIRLVRKIETKVYGNTDRLLWLKGRGDDGQFPDDTFA
jgi:hypothetical protein